jgi:hypothetical protein
MSSSSNLTQAAFSILKAAGFSESQIQSALRGEIIQDTTTSHNERQLAVLFATTIPASPAQLKESFLSQLKMKQVDPSVTGIGNIDDPKNVDWSQLKLSPKGIQPYLNAAPGFDVNLSNEEIQTFANLKKSNASHDAVCKAFTQILQNRVDKYRAMGLAGILPYRRKNGDYFPGNELQDSLDQSVVLQQHCPRLHQILKEYPKIPEDARSNLEEAWFWVASEIDEKLTVSLIHHLGYTQADSFFFCERQFYVSRSHNSVQGVGGMFPLDQGGSFAIYVTRTSTDQVAGFGGAAKRTIGARIMSTKIAANIQQARQLFGGKCDAP